MLFELAGIRKDSQGPSLRISQILNFTKKYKVWLSKNLFSTFLLFKANEKFYVCDVPFLVKNLWISVDQFEAIYKWNPSDRRRFVIPKLAIQTFLTDAIEFESA